MMITILELVLTKYLHLELELEPFHK